MPPIYLDNHATTPLDPRVLEAMLPLFQQHFGNASSRTHPFGWYTAELVAQARSEIATFVNATADEIVFTSGATESNNLAIRGLAGAAATVCLSADTEHRAVLEPLAASGRELNYLAVNNQGQLAGWPADFSTNGRPGLACLMLANNEIGVVHPIAEYSQKAKRQGLLFFCDATAAAGRLPVDVKALGVDLLSLSAHKFYGPKGIGILYIRKELQPQLKAQICGGGQEGGLRAGTLNVPAIVGFAKACRLAAENLTCEPQRLAEMAQELLRRLGSDPGGLTLIGPSAQRLPGNINISFAGVSNSALLAKIQTKLAVSTSSACSSEEGRSSHVLTALKLPPEISRGAIRIGLGRFNTSTDIVAAAAILARAVKALRR